MMNNKNARPRAVPAHRKDETLSVTDSDGGAEVTLSDALDNTRVVDMSFKDFVNTHKRRVAASPTPPLMNRIVTAATNGRKAAPAASEDEDSEDEDSEDEEEDDDEDGVPLEDDDEVAAPEDGDDDDDGDDDEIDEEEEEEDRRQDSMRRGAPKDINNSRAGHTNAQPWMASGARSLRGPNTNNSMEYPPTPRGAGAHRGGAAAMASGGNRNAGDPETVPSEGFASIEEEKVDLLFKLDRLRRKGYKVRVLDDNNAMVDIRKEHTRIKGELDLDHSIGISRKILMTAVSTIEFLNKRYDPLDLALDGWSESIMENINSYDNVLERLYYKYKNRVAMPPELELLVTLAGSAFMFHMTHSLFKAAINQGNQGNPDLIQSMMNAFVGMTKGAGGPAAAAPPTDPSSSAAAAASQQQQQQQQPQQQQPTQQQQQQNSAPFQFPMGGAANGNNYPVAPAPSSIPMPQMMLQNAANGIGSNAPQQQQPSSGYKIKGPSVDLGAATGGLNPASILPAVSSLLGGSGAGGAASLLSSLFGGSSGSSSSNNSAPGVIMALNSVAAAAASNNTMGGPVMANPIPSDAVRMPPRPLEMEDERFQTPSMRAAAANGLAAINGLGGGSLASMMAASNAASQSSNGRGVTFASPVAGTAQPPAIQQQQAPSQQQVMYQDSQRYAAPPPGTVLIMRPSSAANAPILPEPSVAIDDAGSLSSVSDSDAPAAAPLFAATRKPAPSPASAPEIQSADDDKLSDINSEDLQTVHTDVLSTGLLSDDDESKRLRTVSLRAGAPVRRGRKNGGGKILTI